MKMKSALTHTISEVEREWT